MQTIITNVKINCMFKILNVLVVEHFQYPAYEQKFRKRGIKNHSAISSDDSNVSVNTIRVDNVCSCSDSHCNYKHSSQVQDGVINIEDKKVKIKVDTRADVSLMFLKVIKKMNCQFKIKPTEYVLKAFEGSKSKPNGVVNLCCKYKHKYMKILW